MSPKTKPWRPETDKDGEVRMDSLNAASRKDVQDWMRARLFRLDPFFPEHPDQESDPPVLFVHVWSLAGQGDRIKEHLEGAAVELLREFLAQSRKLDDRQADYAEFLLRLLTAIRPIEAKDVLEPLIRRGGFKKKKFTDFDLDPYFVAAYAALGEHADQRLLEALLKEKDYGPEAYWGFVLQDGGEPVKAARYFLDLLEHFKGDQRSFGLSQLLVHLNGRFRDETRPGIGVLLSHLPDLPAWARDVLAESCATVGIELPVPEGDRANGYQRLSPGERARLDRRIKEKFPAAILPKSDPSALRAWMGQAA